MFDQYPDVLTAEEACEALRIGENTMYELLNCKDLKVYRVGRVWRIPKQSLKDYILKTIEKATREK